jgi:hypothetical protein
VQGHPIFQEIQHTHTLSGQNAKFINVKASDTHTVITAVLKRVALHSHMFVYENTYSS